MNRLRSPLGDVQVVAVTREQDVSVNVNSAGQVTSIEIGDSTLDLGGASLAGGFMALIRAANLDAPEQVLHLSEDLLGVDVPTLTTLRESYANPYPEREGADPRLHSPNGRAQTPAFRR